MDTSHSPSESVFFSSPQTPSTDDSPGASHRQPAGMDRVLQPSSGVPMFPLAVAVSSSLSDSLPFDGGDSSDSDLSSFVELIDGASDGDTSNPNPSSSSTVSAGADDGDLDVDGTIFMPFPVIAPVVPPAAFQPPPFPPYQSFSSDPPLTPTAPPPDLYDFSSSPIPRTTSDPQYVFPQLDSLFLSFFLSFFLLLLLSTHFFSSLFSKRVWDHASSPISRRWRIHVHAS